eukprot:1046315-Prymnesium_polylepis.1
MGSLVYMLVAAGNLLRVTVPLSERLFGAPFLGGCRQLQQPPRTFAMYTGFWLITLALKVGFDYAFLIEPLVKPTRALWQFDMYCWGYNRGGYDCRIDMVDLLDEAKNVA